MELKKIPRKSRVIPFGYSVDDTGKILLPIESELLALEKAKNYLKTCSYREVAKWLTATTKRYISYVGLKKRIVRDNATKAKEAKNHQAESQAIG